MKIMVSCGELSGDMYAGALAAEIHALDPSAEIFGLGGERLRAAGVRLIGDYRGLTVTGLIEVLKILPRSVAMYRRLVAAARAERPDVFVAIDFPDFNFRLAGAVKTLGIPVVYYVSPQLWAWRPGRMRTLQRIADRVLVIFRFEESLYQRAGVDVEFVGHPLIDVARLSETKSAFVTGLGLDPTRPVVALLPGSRPNEVRSILPVLLQAAPLLSARVPGTQFVIARAPDLDDRLFRTIEGRVSHVAVVENKTDDVLAASDLVITASGTATIQAALYERSMIVVYKLSPLTYRLGKPFVRVDRYAMVNLVAGRNVVPELIQDAFSASAVADEAVSLLTDEARRRSVAAELRRVRGELGGPGATHRAALAVLAVGRRRQAA